MRFGAFFSTVGGLATAVERASLVGAEVMQVFPGSSRSLRIARTEADVASRFREECKAKQIGCYVHLPYVLSLASTEAARWEQSVGGLIEGLKWSAEVGALGAVVHLSGMKASGTVEAADQIARACLAAGSADSPRVRILLENSAGQVNTFGSSVAELALLADRLPDRNGVGFCLDTAHLFSAGYDFRDTPSLDSLLTEVSTAIGCERVHVLHLNDSGVPPGAGRDRHADLGVGYIGSQGLSQFLRSGEFGHADVILETPVTKIGGKDLSSQLAHARALLSGEVPADERPPEQLGLW